MAPLVKKVPDPCPRGTFAYLRVHLRLGIEGTYVFIHILFPNIYTYTSEYYFQKSLSAHC